MEALHKILEAKEERAKLRSNIAESEQASVSINLNIAGWPKSNELIHSAYQYMLKDFKHYLMAHRVFIDLKSATQTTDAAGDFFIAPIVKRTVRTKELKELFEQFEQDHPLGRLIDVDLTDSKGQPVSSGKAKRCLICRGKAIECMRLKKHDFEEVQTHTESVLQDFMTQRQIEDLSDDIAAMAVQALVLEVSLSPKPGLVDFIDSGVHSDMDYFSFVRSSSVLHKGFKDIASLAMKQIYLNPEEALPQLRQIGLEMENRMFEATNGVNTQKGAIFLLGLLVYASAHQLFNHQSYEPLQIQKMVQAICADLSDKDQISTCKKVEVTNGQSCFQKYGKAIAGGARLEAEKGFPLVFEIGLPTLQQKLQQEEGRIKHEDLQKAMLHALIGIMAQNNDTNILFRSSDSILQALQIQCKLLMQKDNWDMHDLDFQMIGSFCKTHRISPGGSADLLSLSVFLFLLDYDFNAIKNRVFPSYKGEEDKPESAVKKITVTEN